MAGTGADDYRLEQQDARRFRLAVLDERAAPACLAALQRLSGTGADVAVTAVQALPPERSGNNRVADRAFPVDLGSLTARG